MSLVGRSTQFYSRFDPRSIGSCAVWFDAADANSFTLSGSSVATWADKSGNARNATVSTSFRPTKSGNGVVFNGTNQYLQSTYNIAPTSHDGTTVFVVATFTGTTLTRYALLGDDSGVAASAKQLGITLSSSSAGVMDYCGVQSGSIQTGSGLRSIMLGVGILNNVSNSAQCRHNANALGTATALTPSAGTTALRIGVTGSTLSNYFQGTIHEVIYFSNWLGSNDRWLVEGYLLSKWNMSANRTGQSAVPPLGHPYRGDTPVLRNIVPTDYPVCQLWLDAADSNSLVLSGSSVTTWFDKSGLSRHASNGVSPTYNGSNGIVFNGTSHYLQVPVSSQPNPAPGETVFAVVTPTGATQRFYSILGSTLSNGRAFGILVGATTRNVRYDRGGTLGLTGANGPAEGVRFLATGVYLTRNVVGSNSFDVFINGGTRTQTTVASANSTWTGSATTNIGTRFLTSLSNYFQGTLHELIIFNSTSNISSTSNLNSNYTRQIENYLTAKWGLTASAPVGHPARISPGVGGPRFTPTTIATNACTLWLDAADLSTITLAGTTVTGWADKSSNGPRTLTRVGSPQYVQSSLLNNLNCVSFSSSSSFFWSFTQAQPFTVFVVTAQLSAVSDVYSFILEPNTSTAPVILFAPNPNPPGVLVIASGGTQLARNPAVVYFNGIAGVVTAVFSTTSSVIGWNGTFTTGSVGTGSWGGLYLGRDWSGAFVDQQVGEVLFYSGVMALQQRQQVEGYLAWKWGFRSQLPSDHPYRNVKLY